MKALHRQLQQGFTLIEMIVSLALFSVVITISVGALLALVSSNVQLQQEQSVMTNLSFAIDSMTREMRTGTFYYCASRPQYNSGGPQAIFEDVDSQETLAENTRDCFNGNNSSHSLQGVSFVEGGDSISGTNNRILYFYDSTGGPNDGKILRRVGDGPAQSIVSSGIYVTNAEFFVSGSVAQSNGEDSQASITIFIEARDVTDPAGKTYQMQTTVTQRSLDI